MNCNIDNINKVITVNIRALFLITFICVCTRTIPAQTTMDPKSIFNQDNSSLKSILSQSNDLNSLNKAVIQDGPVDPQEYIVGPGDIFSINIWAATPLLFEQPVTPEGSIIVPTVNVIPIAGLTLDSARKVVINEIKKKYISGNASFTLVTPRQFAVTVRGSVLHEGTVIVQATQRIDGAIEVADDKRVYKEENVASLNTSEEEAIISGKIKNASKRHITVIHKNGTMVHADIEKYYAIHNNRYNPLLRDGDVVIVPKSDVIKNFVGIYGAVAREGKYEFVGEDTPRDLIAIAGGLTILADSNKVFVLRTSRNGAPQEIQVDIKNSLNQSSLSIPLLQGDRVIVGERGLVVNTGVVSVEGEVKHPGPYPIVIDSTKLSDVIKRAGGFTSIASLNRAYIVYSNETQANKGKEVLNLLRGLTTAEDTAYLRNAILRKTNNEYTSVDFMQLFQGNDSTKDVILHDGDRIVIPKTMNSIYIFGEVQKPGYVAYRSAASLNDYIALAGGITEDGKKGEIRIIKAGTKQWLDPNETTIEEGDFIWVPKSPYRTTSYYLTLYSQAFSIFATVATLYLIFKK